MNVDTLILSGLYDFSSDLVCLELEKRGAQYLRLNRETLPQCKIALDPFQPALKVQLEGRVYLINEHLKSVFFRQPIFFRNTPERPLSEEEQLERSQWLALARSIMCFRYARWYNWPQNVYLAEVKPYQMYMASNLGFSIPKTVVTNDYFTVESSFHGEGIIKSLDTVLIRDQDDILFTYSSVSNVNELRNYDVQQAPFIFQDYVSQKSDVRVTIIEDAVYSHEILSGDKNIKGDWRVIPKEQLAFKRFEIPGSIKHKCFQLLEELGLRYGAIDLLKVDDHYYFLEVNPTGEWGWLNSKECRIDKKIADTLLC